MYKGSKGFDEERGIFLMKRKSETSDLRRHKTTWIALLSLLIPIFIPLIHMVAFDKLWGHLAHPVDPRTCTCACWDTVFKGPYETGLSGYKHVYFNSTMESFKMWVLTVLMVVFFYESFKRIMKLASERKIRLSMLFLFLTSIHSHYYAFWGHWNYINDNFYKLWYHQVFFTISELVSSAIVVYYMDRRKGMSPIGMLIVGSISLFHIISSSMDQFVVTVIQQMGADHQILRDLLLMTTDIVHAAIAFCELKRYSKMKGLSLIRVLSQKNSVIAIASSVISMYLFVSCFP